jgi:hypothetical protein
VAGVGKDRCEDSSHFFYLLFSHKNLPLSIFSVGVIATRDIKGSPKIKLFDLQVKLAQQPHKHLKIPNLKNQI